MKNDAYLSTGEAAKFLGISRSTVSRRFDDGALLGKAHPITGERLISLASIERFLKKHVHSADTHHLITRHLLLRSDKQDLIGLLESIAAGEQRIKMDVVARGSEALIAYARKAADLLVLDDGATDIACPDIIRALRGLDDRHKMPMLCILRGSSLQQAACWNADAIIPLVDLKRESLEARLYELLQLAPTEHSDAAPVEHKRRWPRHAINVPCTIGLYRVRRPDEHTWGSALVDNISLGGAGLSDVRVDSNSLPAESFRMMLQIDEPLLPSWQANCQVVRLKVNGEVTAGVQFVELSQESRDKILAFERVSSRG